MPWEHRKSDDCPPDKPWGVFNKRTGRKVACHKNEASAMRQVAALYANVQESHMSEVMNTVRPLSFAEFKDDLLWIQALPAKTWQTMMYGEVVVTKDKLDRMVQNFKSNVRGQEIATNFEHGLDPAKGRKASGWIRDAKLQGDSLYVGMEPTPTARQEILDNEWKYFSLEWEDYWQNPETERVHQDVIVGGALTNVPVAKNLMPINFSELYQEVEGGKLEGEETKTEVKDEHAAEEHQEPGGGEPDPDTNPDDAHPDRHLTVPGDSEEVDEEGRPVTNTKEEDMEKELDAKLREALGLAEDADILKAVTDLKEEVGPLREVAKNFSERKAFAEAFPEQARELSELRTQRIEGNAIKFSEEFGKVEFGDSKRMFSQLVLDKIADTHKKFSEGVASVDDFESVLKTMTDEKALVEYSERGSERQEPVRFSESGNPRVQFSEAVKAIMDADEIAYPQAVKIAAERHPELAEAYQNTTVRA